MDKAELVAKAPDYYVAAITYVLVDASYPYTRDKIAKELESELREELFDEAVHRMQKRGIILVERDDFAPPLYRKTNSTHNWWRNEASNEIAFAARLQGLSYADQADWLRRGLSALNHRAWSAGLKASDFAGEPPDEWQP